MQRRRIITNARTEWTPLDTVLRRVVAKLRRQQEEFAGQQAPDESAGPGDVRYAQTVIADHATGEDARGFSRIKSRQVHSGRWRVERAGRNWMHQIEATAANTP
jgi:hypothetical protein